jgi:hypothetical protein
VGVGGGVKGESSRIVDCLTKGLRFRSVLVAPALRKPEIDRNYSTLHSGFAGAVWHFAIAKIILSVSFELWFERPRFSSLSGSLLAKL